MKRFGIRALSVLLAGGLLSGLLYHPTYAADACQTLLAQMTTEEKVSQMLMPTFRYYTDDTGDRHPLEEITPSVKASLQKHSYAGVVLYAQNAVETEKNVMLIDAMQKANASVEGRPQLLVAADQEGGRNTRLGQGTQMPGNMAMGATGDLSATATEARIIGQELQAIGYNFDFAPVVDVNNNPVNPVIGVRSFSDDPEIVAEQGIAYMKALRETGTISSLKHFPGHGDTDTDSHTGLPSISKTYEELKACELIPFQACIDEGADAVMTAHIQYPNIETETYRSKLIGEDIYLPATLSKTILTDMLRVDMGFDGVIITDALNMDAIEKHFDRLDVARLAIEAGADILLIPLDTSTEEGILDLDQYITDVANMVEKGEISKEKVDAAVLRILSLKEEKNMLEPYDDSDLEARVAEAVSFVGSPANHEVEWDLAKQTVTLVKNDGNVLPLTRSGQKVTVLTPFNDEDLNVEDVADRLRNEGKLAEDTVISVHSIGGMDFDAVSPLLEGQDHVVVISEISRAVEMDPAQTAGAYSALVDKIITTVHAAGGKVTILSTRLPYDAARYQAADAILLAWLSKGMSEDPRNPGNGAMKQYGPNMLAALYLAFSPDESPNGKLPVNIPALDSDYNYSTQTLYARGYGLNYEGYRYCPKDSTCPINKFTDSRSDAWYHNGIHWALGEGIMKGTGDTTFEPDSRTTRAMVVTMLWRMSGEPAGSVPAFFDDVNSNAWYADAVAWAAEIGAVKGTSDTAFSPNTPVTREQLAAILYRYVQSQGKGFTGAWAFPLNFPDAGNVSEYAYEAMCWMTMNGIITGMDDGTLAPGDNATRAQIATMFMRFAESIAK